MINNYKVITRNRGVKDRALLDKCNLVMLAWIYQEVHTGVRVSMKVVLRPFAQNH